ncbi:putative gustatory receptor 28b [Periplaneta americana]|uniref:putative gustatory receptor 28b n=1 Tax=Periplaneta americana TaxID=6978 RepID=UPI0037E7975D
MGYVMCMLIPQDAKDYYIQFVYFSIYVLESVTIMQFIYSVLILKDRFETLNTELLSLFGVDMEGTLIELQLRFGQVETMTNKEEETDSIANDGSQKTQHCEESLLKCSNIKFGNLEEINLRSSSKTWQRSMRIRKLRGIHNILCDAAELTNSIYQVQVLMDLIGVLVEITSCLYLTLTYAAKLLTCQLMSPLQWNLLGLFLVWVAINLSKLFAIMVSCRGASKAANHTAELVHKLLVLQPLHSNSSAELQLFSQQLMHSKLHFTACGLFTIDFTLLYSMASAVTTYLIILLQYSGHDIVDIMKLCNKTAHTTV